MTVIKKIPTAPKSTRVKARSDSTTTYSGITNKPFILQEIGTKKDADVYRALRTIFKQNKSFTSSVLDQMDLDELQDLLEKQLENQGVRTRTRKSGVYKKPPNNRRQQRKIKIWKPLI